MKTGCASKFAGVSGLGTKTGVVFGFVDYQGKYLARQGPLGIENEYMRLLCWRKGELIQAPERMLSWYDRVIAEKLQKTKHPKWSCEHYLQPVNTGPPPRCNVFRFTCGALFFVNG